MALVVEITVKGTMMTGQDMGPTLPLIANPLVTLPPTPQNRQESEMGTSGTETAAMDGLDLPLFTSLSPCFLCYVSLLLLLSPPCGDNWLLQTGSKGFFFSVSPKHIMRKLKKSFHLVTPAEVKQAS